MIYLFMKKLVNKIQNKNKIVKKKANKKFTFSKSRYQAKNIDIKDTDFNILILF